MTDDHTTSPLCEVPYCAVFGCQSGAPHCTGNRGQPQSPSTQYAQPCSAHEYIEPNCSDCSKLFDQSSSTSRPYGDAGDATDWACDHYKGDRPTDFLEAWREGDLAEYPDYLKWVSFQQKCAAEAKSKEQSND